MILSFGKYKGYLIDDVFKIDASYVQWLYENHTNNLIRDYCESIIKYSSNCEPLSKVESIVYDCIISRGYSESEANMFLKKLKTQKNE